MSVPNVLVALVGFGLSVQAVIGLGFFVSSIIEREKRASFFGGLQFLAMLALLVGYVWLAQTGFFSQPVGLVIIILLLLFGGAILFLVLRRDKPNLRALAGSEGYKVGSVTRFDERDIVFARMRSLRQGSKEFEAYYEIRPENLEYDEQRRTKGGPLGVLGSIDGRAISL